MSSLTPVDDAASVEQLERSLASVNDFVAALVERCRANNVPVDDIVGVDAASFKSGFAGAV